MPMFVPLLLALTVGLTARAEGPDALRTAGLMGDCATARALISRENPSEAEILLLGQCAAVDTASGASSSEVLALLQGIDEKSLFRPHAAFFSARLILGPEEASTSASPEAATRVLHLLEGRSLPGASGDALRLLRARAMVLAGKVQEARAELVKLENSSLGLEASWWLAECSRISGDTTAARQAWERLWSRHPASRQADRAASSLESLGVRIPDYTSREGRALALERAMALKKARLAVASLEILRQIEAHGGPGTVPAAREEPSWTYRVADTCFEARDYRCAVEGYVRLGSPTGAAVPGNADTVFDHALALTRLGRHGEAIEVYRSLQARYPESKKAEFASFKVGYVELDRGRLQEAVAGFEEHLRRHPSGEHADEARWFVAWTRMRLGDIDDAQKRWDEILTRNPKSELAPLAAYWRARTSPADRQPELFRQVRRRFPSSGPAWFAGWRLGLETGLPWPEEPALPAFPPELLARESGLRLAEALYGVGLDEEAALAYAAVSPRITETRARRALGLRLVRVGRVKAAKAHVTCGSAQDAESRAIEREICHPRPHADLVGGLLRGTELDPFLPYAIMTAESAMNPSVTSAAGARGIMQIMPEVGARLHEARYPGRPFHAQDLYRSGYNALLGTTELLGLQSRFRELGVEEPLPLTIAAYNGGREAVERWLEASRRASRFEIDTFSEDISFTETRRYVRTVLGYLEAYHRAWGVHGTP